MNETYVDLKYRNEVVQDVGTGHFTYFYACQKMIEEISSNSQDFSRSRLLGRVKLYSL